MIPLSEPSIKGNEWIYIKECLDTGWVSSAGKYVDLFEKRICEYTGAKYAIACVNGTSALHLSLLLSGVKAGDEVIVPTLTFIAPINAISYINASPIFMDADDYYNIDAEKTIQFIKTHTVYKNGNTINKITRNKIKAIIPVHVFGNAVNIEPLLEICSDRNISIVEDATESLGTFYATGELINKHCGTIGKVGCLSFNGNKIITTGGGGMLLTDDANIAEKANYLSTQAKDDPVRYIHNEVGYNFRLTNLQAAIGVAQLEQLPNHLTKKTKIYHTYKIKVDKIDGLKIAGVPGYAVNNHWLVPLQINQERYYLDRDGLMDYFAQHSIETRPVWHLNHLQKPYKHFQHFRIEKACDLVEKTLSLPSSVEITETQISSVIDQLENG
jgi:perosamine synthetase